MASLHGLQLTAHVLDRLVQGVHLVVQIQIGLRPSWGVLAP
jgi:hypothetical protein